MAGTLITILSSVSLVPCDRHGCLGHHKAHAFSHRHFGLGAPPTRQHYKGVIDADACGVDL